MIDSCHKKAMKNTGTLYLVLWKHIFNLGKTIKKHG